MKKKNPKKKILTSWYVCAIKNSIRYDEMVKQKLWPISCLFSIYPSIEQLIFGIDFDKGKRTVEGIVQFHSANGTERRNYTNPKIKKKTDDFECEFWNLLNLAFQKNELRSYDPPLLMRGNTKINHNFQKEKWVTPDELFKWMKKKGYPISDTLIDIFEKQSLDDSNLELAASQLKIFRKNILYRMVKGENPAEVSNSTTRPSTFTKSAISRRRGRRSNINWLAVEDKAQQIRNKIALSAPQIAYHSEITKILAPNAFHVGQKAISEEEYKKRYGVAFRTVVKHIQKVLKVN